MGSSCFTGRIIVAPVLTSLDHYPKSWLTVDCAHHQLFNGLERVHKQITGRDPARHRAAALAPTHLRDLPDGLAALPTFVLHQCDL
jgi:hypothetical protein